jgi:hypothetical protein
VYRRPQLRHCPGLAGAPCFYETHQVRLALAYGGEVCSRAVFSILRIDHEKHGSVLLTARPPGLACCRIWSLFKKLVGFCLKMRA